MSRFDRAGFTIIELLIVIAIIGILTAIIITSVMVSRRKAVDNQIMNDVRQLRILAEEVYDSQAASYLNWADSEAQPNLANQLDRLLADLDQIHNYTQTDVTDPQHVTITRDSQAQEFCISVPLYTDPSIIYCVDATGQYQKTSSHCPDYPATGQPLRCPVSN